MRALLRPSILGLCLSATVSCVSMGPKTIPTDQFNYNAAIATSSSEQLLLNIVRLRYNETPVFLKVSSVINQYARTASVGASAGANTNLTGENTASVSGSAAWWDRPTITYMPLSGREFATNLLTPLPAESLFQLLLNGWPPDLVFSIAVISINGLDNELARPSRRREADPRFLELLQLWNRLRAEQALGMRIEKGQEKSVVLFFPERALDEQIRSDRARFSELLGLDTNASEFHLVSGLIPGKSDEIALLTGSIWDVMVGLSWRFDVPPEHVEQRRTGETFQAAMPGRPMIQVKYDRERPAEAIVAVFSRGYWFYIDDRDMDSKGAFSFLQLLLSLAETGTVGAGPLVTISN